LGSALIFTQPQPMQDLQKKQFLCMKLPSSEQMWLVSARKALSG